MLLSSQGVVAEVRADGGFGRLLARDLPYGSTQVDDGRPVARFTVRVAEGGWDVARDGRPVVAAAPIDVALATLQNHLQVLFAELAEGRVFVHAGAVSVAGRAIVLPGRSLAGKTTLTAALVQAGAAYLSDEYAVFDADGLVHPFARPLQLRSPAGGQRVDPGSLGCVETGAVPLGLVACLVHEPGGGSAFAPSTPGQAMLDLVENAVAARSRTIEVMAALSAASRGKPGVRGRRGEAAEAAVELLRLAQA